MMARWRSLLFVAADDHARLARISGRGADAIILDLEDAVPPERKPIARAGLAAVVADLVAQDCDIVVRMNSGWRAVLDELDILVRAGIAAVMVPKVECAERLAIIAEMMAAIADDRGLPQAPEIIALIESPAGIAALDRVAAIPGLCALALGSEDFSLALGVSPTSPALELPCRLVALAAAGRGLMAFGLPVSIATIADEGAWSDGVRLARAVGMTGAMCIHPRQIDAVNRGFAPTQEEIESARLVLKAWQDAGAQGVVQVGGKMIDRPVALRAMRLLHHFPEEKLTK
jgi:citrate lyase subunit beta/citryl-CoA lyase